MSDYLQQLVTHLSSRYPLLSRAAETELAGRAQAGDTDARALLIYHNVKFGYAIARRYRRHAKGPLELDDLFSTALEALWIAAGFYRPNPTARFVSFAVYYIHQRIHTACAKGSCLPYKAYQFRFSLGKAANRIGSDKLEDVYAALSPALRANYTDMGTIKKIAEREEPASLSAPARGIDPHSAPLIDCGASSEPSPDRALVDPNTTRAARGLVATQSATCCGFARTLRHRCARRRSPNDQDSAGHGNQS